MQCKIETVDTMTTEQTTFFIIFSIKTLITNCLAVQCACHLQLPIYLDCSLCK